MNDKEFCNSLIRLRSQKGMTQRELEIKSDLAETSVSHYENGERQPGLSTIRALCKGLGCTPNDLLQ